MNPTMHLKTPRNFLVQTVQVVLAFGAGWIIGLFIYYGLADPARIGGIVYDWQALIGSLVGAAAPLGLFFVTTWYQKKNAQKEYFFLLEKNLVTTINNLADVDRMLHTFQNKQLRRFKERIEEDDGAGRLSVGQAFVPLSWTFTFDKELFKESTGSSYLENLVMQVVSTSQEMPILLQDVSRQFDRTLNLNTQIGLMKLNSPTAHNQILRDNIREFENFLIMQTFGNNIPIYLRMLVQTKVALQTRMKMGLSGWKRTFNFKGPFSTETSQKMNDYFKSEVDKQITELKTEFQSNLLLVGENPASSIE